MTHKRRLILKLKDIVTSGYLPSRGLEPYQGMTAYHQKIDQLGNCLEHAVFNLTNSQFSEYAFLEKEGDVFGKFSTTPSLPRIVTEAEVCEFVKRTGLKINECELNPQLKKNQWIVAMYFEEDPIIGRDFHFIRQEKDGKWTGKRGYTDRIQTFDKMPFHIYEQEFYKTFIVTNPYVKER